MQVRMGWNPYVKGLVFWAIFMAMSLLYRALPVFPLSVICAINESNFQHYKAGFFAYLIASIIEYAFTRRQVQDRTRFWFSRLSAATFVPWFMFVFWYFAPAVVGRWSATILEIIYANVIFFIVAFFVPIFEQGLEQIIFSRQLKFVILVLFCVSILLYLVFTFNLPWADVFVEPNWR